MERQLYSRREFLEITGKMAEVALLGRVLEPGTSFPQTAARPFIFRKCGFQADIVASIQPVQTDIRSAMLPEIDMIRQKSTISRFGREKLEATMTAVKEMDQKGYLRWYIISEDQIPSFLVNPIPFGVTCFDNPYSSIWIYGLESGIARVLETSSHETYHASRFYDRIKDRRSCRWSFEELEDEERNAQFLGWLTETAGAYDFGITDGFKEDRFFDSSGAKDAPIIWYLDKNGYDPDSRLYRYIYDMQRRYFNLRYGTNKEELKKVTENAIKWGENPLTNPEDLAAVAVIKLNGWVKPDFFLN